MKVGIDLNNVLRDTFGKFTQLYQKNLIEENYEEFADPTYDLDESGNTELNEVRVFEYKMSLPIDTFDLQNHFKFQSDEEFYSFMYEEFPMQIFGHAGSSENNTFNLLNDFYIEQRDQNDIIIISEEAGKAKPATLFFLSKFGCLIEKIRFYSKSTKDSIWDDIDILLTANPELLLNYPTEKIVIKFETEYNKNINSEHIIKSLSELTDIFKKITK